MVNWLGRVMGNFDLYGDVSCPNIDHLARLIDERISKVREVRETKVVLHTETYEHTAMPGSTLLEGRPGEGASWDLPRAQPGDGPCRALPACRSASWGMASRAALHRGRRPSHRDC